MSTYHNCPTQWEPANLFYLEKTSTVFKNLRDLHSINARVSKQLPGLQVSLLKTGHQEKHVISRKYRRSHSVYTYYLKRTKTRLFLEMIFLGPTMEIIYVHKAFWVSLLRNKYLVYNAKSGSQGKKTDKFKASLGYIVRSCLRTT